VSLLARPASRLSTGSTTVVRRLAARAAAWCARGRRDDLTGWRAVLGVFARLAVLVFGVYLAARIVRALPALMWLLTAAWTAAAWRAGKPRTEASEDAEESSPAPASDDVREATLEWIWQRIGDAQGVHLRDLLTHAQEHGMFEDLDVTSLRAHLKRWDIPVRNRCRVRGLGVTVGIHRDDLKTHSSPSPNPGPQETPETELHAA
jgi:hypothetical protein